MRMRFLGYPGVVALIALGPQVMGLSLMSVVTASFAQQGLSAGSLELWQSWQTPQGM